MSFLRLPQLDAARGLAACVVLAVHLAQTFWMPIAGPAHWLVPILGSAGRHAVLVFYLLSGFLIVQSIGHNIRTHGVFAGRSYFFSRLARLYPPLLLAIVSTTLVAWLINGLALNGSVSQPFQALGLGLGVTPAYAMSPWEPVQSALFVRGFALVNPPFWSLFVEARLYLVAGLLALGATRPGAFRVFLPLGFGLLALCLWEDAAFWVYATVWSAGGVTGWLVQTRYRFIRTGLSMLAIGYLLYLAFARPGQLSIYEPDAQLNQFMQVTWGLAYAALLFDLRWPLRWLALPQQVAGWSYTLYLLHWPYLVLVLSLSQVWIGVSPWRATCMTALAALVALGTGRWAGYWAERPAYFRNLLEQAWQRHIVRTPGLDRTDRREPT